MKTIGVVFRAVRNRTNADHRTALLYLRQHLKSHPQCCHSDPKKWHSVLNTPSTKWSSNCNSALFDSAAAKFAENCISYCWLESNVTWFENCVPEQLSVLIERIKGRSRSLVKKDRKAHAEKSVRAEGSLNPGMFQLYFENGLVADMRDLLDYSASGLTAGNKKDVRNHLILRILSANCCRLGTFMNMTN